MNDIKNKYTDIINPGSFSGVNSFIKNNPKFKINEVKKALESIEAYTLHKPVIKKFARTKTIVNAIDESWQIDLIDVNNLKNKSLKQWFNYLFTCIDVLSKYAFVVPIANKSSESTKNAFQFVIESSKRKPLYLYSDNGFYILYIFIKITKI